VWAVTGFGQLQGQPLIAEGKVFAGSSDGHLYAVELMTGLRIWDWRAPGDKPAISDPDEAADPDPSETMEIDVSGLVDDTAKPLVGSGGGAISDAASSAATELTDEKTKEPDAPRPQPSQQGGRAEPATIDLFGAEQAASESAALDDDSFFASLRDAVRDDTPLGPRDESERAFFDQDEKDSPSFREAFKRRR